MRARARTLAAAKIAVGSRGAALARGDEIAVDADAHRAARLGPFEPGVAKDAVEAFLLGLALDAGRPRRHQAGHLADAAAQDRGSCAQILDARVGAGADEDAV